MEWLGLLHGSESDQLVDTFPLVTVIMPIRNEAAYIRRSLATVRAQDYPLG